MQHPVFLFAKSASPTCGTLAYFLIFKMWAKYLRLVLTLDEINLQKFWHIHSVTLNKCKKN